jgi:hypothetical protein
MTSDQRGNLLVLGLIIVGNSEMVEMNFSTNELRPSQAEENRSHGQGPWISGD